MNVYDFLGQNAFWSVNKKIARKTSVNAALLLSDLISKRQYFIVKHGKSVDEMFYNTVENIKLDTTLSKYQQSKAVKELEDAGFLLTEFKGNPRKKFFKLLDKSIIDFMQSEEDEKGVDHKRSKNLTTRSQKTSPLEVKKLDHSINKNKCNENKPNKNKVTNCSSQTDFYFSSVGKCLDYIREHKKLHKKHVKEELRKELGEFYALINDYYVFSVTDKNNPNEL